VRRSDLRVYDISRPLGPSTVVWPGDVEVTLDRTLSRSEGEKVNTGVLRTSLHAATHVDAPLHVLDEGISVGEVDLTRCLGPARVVDVGDVGSIGPGRLPALTGVSRVLFKTGRSRALGGGSRSSTFSSSFAALEPATAVALADAGVVLVGVDTPSIDPADSEDLPAHGVLLGREVVVLENLWLGEVEAGDYELIALPLRLEGGDGSPVRAVLRTLSKASLRA
jgi:arylformamidase